MKLNFTNKKDRRYCQNFIKGIKQVQNQNQKDQQFTVFLTANSEQLKLASSIEDLHRQRVSKSCTVIIKPDAYTLQLHEQKNQFNVYRLSCFKMMKAFKKYEGKVTMIQLQLEDQVATLTFQTQIMNMICQLKIECEEVKQRWPEQPHSEEQSSYQIIKLSNLTEEQLKAISLDLEEEEVWLQIWEGGIYLRTVENGKFRKQNKLILKEDNGFVSTTVKAKLKRKLFIQIRGEFLLQILHDSLKKKKTISLSIKNIYNRYNENQIAMSYLIAKSENDCGYTIGVNYCHICEEMGKEGDQLIRRQIANDKQARESTLLKRQEGIEETRRLMLNRLNEVDEDKRIAEAAYKERKPVGKIQEGEQTFTRKFCSKF